MPDTPPLPPENSGRPQNLGTILRTARERKGLELSDVAEVTHVRKEYLLALEEGRYSDLPEDVYSRNFLRLFAQAVDLESGRLLEMFTRERSGLHTPRPSPGSGSRNATAGGAASTSSGPTGGGGTQRGAGASAEPPVARGASTPERTHRDEHTWVSGRGEPRGPAPAGQGAGVRSLRVPAMRIGSLLATLLLIVAIVAVALWAFNALLFSGGRTPVEPPTAESGGIAVPPPATTGTPATAAPEGTPEATEQARDVLLTVESEPPGAEVTVDGFPMPGNTPVQDEPVTARASRLVRVTLDGYAPFEATYDLSFDRTLSVILEPEVIAAPSDVTGPEDTTPSGPPPVAGQGQIALTVTELTWLEVYASTAREQGDRLVYTTAQPGDRYMFDLPVYVHVGNAAGLHVSVNGQDRGVFGSSGAVTGRAFTD